MKGQILWDIEVTGFTILFLFQVLIFSQMTSILDVLGDYCYMRDWRFCRLDGSMNITDRRIQVGY